MKDPDPSTPIRVLSHNIRYATPSPFPGELPWSQRKNGLISQLHYHTRQSSSSPFICLQEVVHEQLVDIQSGLNAPRVVGEDVDKPTEEWAFIGVGRDDGKEKGEYSPIFYRPSDYTRLESSTVWLSETPAKPSKSWDAASIRILTVGLFRHVQSHKIVLALNTHLDDQGAQSREEAAKIILKVTREFVVRGRRWDINGVFLAGDLNSEEDDEAYKVLNGKESGLVDMWNVVNKDSKDTPSNPALPIPNPIQTRALRSKTAIPTKLTPKPSPSPHIYGETSTFTGFSPTGDEPPKRIDFIHLETGLLVREKEKQWNIKDGKKGDKSPWRVEGYSVLPNRFEDGVFMSDHRAVVGDLVLK